MRYGNVHFLEDPGFADVTDLGLNTFLRSSSHVAVADRIAGVRAYRALLGTLNNGMARAIAAAGDQGGAEIISKAQDLVERANLRVAKAEDLVNAGKAAIQGRSLDSNNPPAGTTVEDWQVAYGVDFDEIAAALKAIDQVITPAQNAMADALRWAQALKVQRGEANAASIPPKDKPAQSIDWKDPEIIVRPEVKAAANAVGATISSAAGGIGFGLVIVAAVVAFMYMGGRR